MAMTASAGCKIPFKMILSFVNFLILAMVSQFNDRSLFFKYDILYLGPLLEDFEISYKTGNSNFELSNRYITYFLLVPKT